MALKIAKAHKNAIHETITKLDLKSDLSNMKVYDATFKTVKNNTIILPLSDVTLVFPKTKEGEELSSFINKHGSTILDKSTFLLEGYSKFKPNSVNPKFLKGLDLINDAISVLTNKTPVNLSSKILKYSTKSNPIVAIAIEVVTPSYLGKLDVHDNIAEKETLEALKKLFSPKNDLNFDSKQFNEHKIKQDATVVNQNKM